MKIWKRQNIECNQRTKVFFPIREDVFAMSKLVDKYACEDITGPILKHIYFSQVNGSHGPRIKFYGGTTSTDSTKHCPSMEFGVDGPAKVIIRPWMNKKNCPNAFDESLLDLVRQFIYRNRAVLLLVWFKRLDEADALHYFEGSLSWEDMLTCIDTCADILSCVSSAELHSLCKQNHLYTFSR